MNSEFKSCMLVILWDFLQKDSFGFISGEKMDPQYLISKELFKSVLYNLLNIMFWHADRSIHFSFPNTGGITA